MKSTDDKKPKKNGALGSFMATLAYRDLKELIREIVNEEIDRREREEEEKNAKRFEAVVSALVRLMS